MKQKPKRRKRKHTTATKKRLLGECYEMRKPLEMRRSPWVGQTKEVNSWVHLRDGKRTVEV
jgi:hypothetical protein